MKLIKLILTGLALVMFFCAGSLSAQELVYNPINPSFVGGNYFNGQWLLAQAQAQNNIKESSDFDYKSYRNDPLTDFNESLNRQILNRLSRDLINNAFGEESFQEEGHYEIGNFFIDIIPGGSGVKIIINDISTGDQTNIEIPYY
jgi:curli production assembly/transport component CsgF